MIREKKTGYVPHYQYGRHHLDEQDIEAVVSTLREGLLTQGPKVPELENKTIEVIGANYAIAMNSATSALHVACLSMGIGSNSKVWVPAISFVATANCAEYCGAKVNFVDVDSSSGNMDLTKLEAALVDAAKNNCLPDLVIVVHLAGMPVDLKRLKNLSLEYGFKVLEDASHAFGSRLDGEMIGSCTLSDAAVFSLHPVKNITSAEGGILVTNDPQISELATLYRSHGIVRDNDRFLTELGRDPWAYEQHYLGFNYRMSDLHAALGSSQLDKLDLFINRRNEIAKYYSHHLQNIGSKIETPCLSDERFFSAFHLFQVRVLNDGGGFNRGSFFGSLLAAGIQSNVHYIPIYLHPYYRKKNPSLYLEGALTFYEGVLCLPIYFGLEEKDLSHIVDQIIQIVGIE